MGNSITGGDTLDKLQRAKENVNIVEYVTNNTSSTVKRAGIGKYFVNPCPVCGSKNHFVLFEDNNSFYSFNGCVDGGSIVDYLMQVEELDKKTAINKTLELAGFDTSENFTPTKRRQKNMNNTAKPKFQKPPELKPLSDEAKKYLNDRGIGSETIALFNIGSDNKGNIAFPYYNRKNKHVLTKYRLTRETGENERKSWASKGGEPVFFGMEKLDLNEPIIIVEGEIDALSLVESGVKNVVSVPFGAKSIDRAVEHNWDFLEKFEEIIIWSDNDEEGERLKQDSIHKFGAYRVRTVEIDDYKDANGMLLKAGRQAVKEAVENAEEVKIAGIVRGAEVESFDPTQVEKVQSSIEKMNETLAGYFMGDLVVWTGINGSGKSTFLSQEIAYAVEQGYPTFVYSGELPDDRFMYWLDLQVAGKDNMIKVTDMHGKKFYRPSDTAKEQMNSWYYDKLFLFNKKDRVREDKLIEIMDMAYRRYGIKVFLLDNLMTMMTGIVENPKEYYRKQADLVNAVKEFASTKNVVVHLVAHPRKAEGRLSKMDVMGAGEITNLADTVVGLHRFGYEEKETMHNQETTVYDSVIDIFKHRFLGEQEKSITIFHDSITKRFYRDGLRSFLDYRFSWDETTDNKDEDPFNNDDSTEETVNNSNVLEGVPF